MATAQEKDVSEASELKLDTRGALADIGFDSTVEQAETPLSDDDTLPDEAVDVEDVQSAIGVSISREQTRLTSPSTPAVEKAAAIQKTGYFFGAFDGTDDALVAEADEDEAAEDVKDDEPLPAEQPDQESASPTQQPTANSTATHPTVTEAELPSPWRVEPKASWKTNERPRSGIFETLLNRKRASSGPDSTIEAWQKSFLSSLPSLPKHLSISSASSSAQESRQKEQTLTPVQSVDRHSDSEPSAPEPAEEGIVVDGARRASVSTIHSRASRLRRSASDHSLVTQRTITHVETLGDDTRWDDVHNQVNSRLKAIKDSWADANFKLPGVPAFKLSSLTADSLRGRAGSLDKRQNARSLSISDPTSPALKPSRPVDPMTRQPYSDAKAAVADATAGKAIPHPHLHRALQQLEGDVVVLGGYRGSVLRSADPPHRQLWIPVKVGLNLRKVNLEVGIDEQDDVHATEHIIPDGMLKNIGPVDISRRLFKRVRSCENAHEGRLRVWDYGYDWRLMPDYLSKQLIEYLKELPCNQADVSKEKRGATVICHSLGGLITRHAVNQRPDLFAGVVYAGVPQTCVNILGPLRNGDEVLVSSRVLTAQVNFSIRTSFALLPLDGRCFFDQETREEYPVDFFDVDTWDELRLSPCINRPLPPLQPPPKPTGITGYVASMASMLPSLPMRGRKGGGRLSETPKVTTAEGIATPNMSSPEDTSTERAEKDESVRTAVTISREDALKYLQRTLAGVKRFKEELAFRQEHADTNMYPPIAVIYGKTVPTVYGARVNGREGIKHADAYDDLAFASGDGVVLASAAMAPEGYKVARHGIVPSDRGHVTLLGDLEAVGKCLNAVIRSRKRGVGYG